MCATMAKRIFSSSSTKEKQQCSAKIILEDSIKSMNCILSTKQLQI